MLEPRSSSQPIAASLNNVAYSRTTLMALSAHSAHQLKHEPRRGRPAVCGDANDSRAGWSRASARSRTGIKLHDAATPAARDYTGRRGPFATRAAHALCSTNLRGHRSSSANLTAPDSSDTRQALSGHRRSLVGRSLLELFDSDPGRASRLSLAWDDWLVDWSKQRLGTDTMSALLAHARARNLEMWIAALFAGEKINLSEQRPVLHTALRRQGEAPLVVDGDDVIPAVRAAQARMRTLATQLRGGLRLGVTGRPIRTV